MGSEENIQYAVVFLGGEMGIGSQFLFLTWHTGLVLNSFLNGVRKYNCGLLRIASLGQDSNPKP